MMNSVMKALLGAMTCLSILALGAAGNAGSVTGTGFDKATTIEDLKSNAPQGVTITDTSCETVGVPSGGTNKYRCTVTWE
jgi:hypothetical protein